MNRKQWINPKWHSLLRIHHLFSPEWHLLRRMGKQCSEMRYAGDVRDFCAVHP
jgi:hypothetical protein